MRKFFHRFWQAVTFPFRFIWRIVSWPFRKAYVFIATEPEDHSLPDVLADTVAHPTVALEHVDALRKHLLRMLVGLIIAIAVCFSFTQQMVDFLAGPVGGITVLRAIDVTESVSVFMRVALLSGFALVSPYLAFELWLFAAPGLRPRERVAGLIGIPLVAVFLIAGMAFAYYVLFPNALPFLLNFMGIQTIPRPSSYINFVTGLMFWIGVTFEFPLVTYVLTAMGIIKPGVLARQWRIAFVIIAVAAAAITPTVDPINMAMVMVPMILLYFIGVGLSYIASAGRNRNTARTNS